MTSEIDQWLEELGLGRYGDVFAENEIGMPALPHITEDDLKEMGVALGARRQLLAAIGALGAASEPSPAQEKDDVADAARRQVTALFADISGFTRMSSAMDAEETHAMLNGFFAVVDEVLRRYGGTVDKHIGDAVMAVFGAPVAHTDDPERALRAALDIHAEVARLEPPLQVHIGVASGQVVASSTGSAAHTEYTVTGDSVNLAARLTDMAKAGETLAAASVQRALGDRFIGVSLGERMIEGLLEPVTLWRLDELGAGPVDGGHAFVGRARELRQFSTALDNCLETGAGETLIVRGEAGIGKTRLVEEFVSLAEAGGFAIHTGLILDFGTAKGQDAVRALVRSLLEIPPGSHKDVRAEAVQSSIASGQLPEARRVHLNDLLDLPQPANLNGLYQAMNNETRNRDLQDTLGDLVRHAGQRRPVLLRIEDTHWADPLILDQLANLTRTVQEIPVLLILTTRVTGDQLDQTWRAGTEGAPLTTADLGPLQPSEANDLADAFEALNDEMIAACVERSGGNPLFLEQLLRNAGDLEAGDIPGTIQGIVQARLDVLAGHDREAIQAASVLGQRFSRTALAALLNNDNYDPVNLLTNVLIRPAGDDFHIAHALIREGVYASMLTPRRTELHRRAAVWFDGDDPILHAEHLDKADDSGAGQAYLEAAIGESEKRRYEPARRLVERALELDTTQQVRFDLICRHGDILRELGQADQSITAFENAIEIAVGDDQSCLANMGLAEGLRIRGRQHEGLACLSIAEASAEAMGSAAYLARVHGLKGNLYFPLGEIDKCMTAHEKALQYGRESGSAEVQARAYSGLADVFYLRGQMLSAGDMFEHCINLARENNLTSVVAANLSMLGLAKFYALENTIARTMFDEALRLSSTIGNYRAEIIVEIALCYTLLERGMFDTALEKSNSVFETSSNYGLDIFAAFSLAQKSKAYFELGHGEKANKVATEAWNLIVEGNFERFTGPWCLGAMVRSAPDEERRNWAIEEGFRILSEEAVGHNYLFFYRDIMEAGLESGDWELLQRACDALTDYTRAEPLPWCDFQIARAQALRDYYQGHDRETAVKTLRQLKEQAERVGLEIALPGINAALGEAGA